MAEMRRFIDTIATPPQSARFSNASFLNFLTALRECLTFHYDIAEHRTKPQAPKWQLLHKALHDGFFTSLYVDRPEYQQLRTYALNENLTSSRARSGAERPRFC